jgi:hypothetical protein
VLQYGRWYFVPFMVGKESRCFEDCERTLEELKSLFFNALYFWTIVYVSPLIINYHVFFVFLLLLPMWLLLYFMCT